MAKNRRSVDVVSVAVAVDDKAIATEVQKVLTEALARAGFDGVEPTVSGGWSQTGGWVREQDGWPQSGGWYLSKNRLRLEDPVQPLDASVPDVFKALARAKAQGEAAE